MVLELSPHLLASPCTRSPADKASFCSAAIPTFSKTSSPELDEALNRYRQELFIPFGLSIHQRKLMFRPKYAQRLRDEPVTVTIGSNDEQYVLRHMDVSSLPSTESIIGAVRMMKTKHDWTNVLPLLVGLRSAGRAVKSEQWQLLIRKAGDADAIGIILECAKRSEQTGLSLKDMNVVKAIFFQLHLKAQRADFKDPEVSKALSLAKQFIELMETPAHSEHHPLADARRQPFVVGLLLELAAARAVNLNGGKDETGEVATYIQRLDGVWHLGEFAGKLNKSKTWYQIDDFLQEILPIYNGTKLAFRVKGIGTKNQTLKSRHEKVAGQIRMILREKVKGDAKTIGYRQTKLLFKK